MVSDQPLLFHYMYAVPHKKLVSMTTYSWQLIAEVVPHKSALTTSEIKSQINLRRQNLNSLKVHVIKLIDSCLLTLLLRN